MAQTETTTVDTGFVEAGDLVARATAMIPALRERAREADELRKLPPATLEDFRAAGFLRIAQPPAHGGMDHDFEVLIDVALQIARGDGASGWLVSFMGLHQWMVGWFSAEAQQEYFATSGPHTSSSTVNGQAFERTEVPGGIRVTGEAKFSSGSDYAEWILLHTSHETCLVPRPDFEIVDNWYVDGLMGTGSKGVRVQDAFVPEHRIVSYQQAAEGTSPGAALWDSPWQQVRNPLMLVLNHAILAPVIGMAYGVLDLFDERARTRKDPQTKRPATLSAGPQLRFAEASAELAAAEMFLRHNLAVVRTSGEDRRALSPEEHATIRRNITYAARISLQATNRLVDGTDSSALYQDSLVHRQARDVRAGALQWILHWETCAMQFSRVHWGVELDGPLI